MTGQQPEQFVERRKVTRTRYVTNVFLTFPGEPVELQGELQDISLFGMYVETARQMAIDTSCTIRIVITARNSRLTLDDLQGKVVRRDAHGMGIRFVAKLEWYVLFNIYSHFSRDGRELDAVSLSDPYDADHS